MYFVRSCSAITHTSLDAAAPPVWYSRFKEVTRARDACMGYYEMEGKIENEMD